MKPKKTEALEDIHTVLPTSCYGQRFSLEPYVPDIPRCSHPRPYWVQWESSKAKSHSDRSFQFLHLGVRLLMKSEVQRNWGIGTCFATSSEYHICSMVKFSVPWTSEVLSFRDRTRPLDNVFIISGSAWEVYSIINSFDETSYSRSSRVTLSGRSSSR